MMSQMKTHRVLFLLLIALAFVIACVVSSPTPASEPVYDPTRAALELQNTAMAMQLTQAAPNPVPSVALTAAVSPLPAISEVPVSQLPPDIQQWVEKYYQKGFLSSTDGEYHHLKDFSMDWSTINLYGKKETGYFPKDFMIKADFKWRSAIPNPDPAGCGWVFRSQGEDYYLFFVDRETVLLGIWEDGKGFTYIGPTDGDAWVGMGNPADATVVLIVNQGKAYVFVNDDYTSSYTLDSDFLTGSGGLYYGVLSGTTKDYGTRCEMTNVELWILNP